MNEQELLEKARKRVKDKKGFYAHLISFVSTLAFLLILNLVTSPDFLWVLIVAGGWGIGVVSHFFTVFGFFGLNGPGWEEKALQKEMDRLRRLKGDPMPNEELLDLEDDRLDLKERIKEKRQYDDEEFV